MDGDALDRKYLHLYEQKIDPFQLEELDRQVLPILRLTSTRIRLSPHPPTNTAFRLSTGCISAYEYI